ncbi:MAG: aminoacyl-tRNA hydrolase [bacterium]
MKLIVGLGNPDKKYFKTRHNAGFLVLDLLQKELPAFSAWTENQKFQSLIATGRINNEKIILAKPLTYMNNSGQAVRVLVDYYQIKPEDIYLVHDDIDISLGQLKIKKTGSAAGHKGIQSVIDQLKTSDFTRLRVGIQPLAGKRQTADKLVLKKFGLLEKKTIKQGLVETVEKLKEIIQS